MLNESLDIARQQMTSLRTELAKILTEARVVRLPDGRRIREIVDMPASEVFNWCEVINKIIVYAKEIKE